MRVWKSLSGFRSTSPESKDQQHSTSGRTRRWFRGRSRRCRCGWPTRGCRPSWQPVGCPNVASEVAAVARSWTRPRQWRSFRVGSMRHGGREMLDDLDLAWEEEDPNRQRRGGPPTRQVRQRRRKEKKRRRRSFGALFISLVLLAALGAGVYWGVGQVQNLFGASDYTSNPSTTPVNVKIESGDYAADIATKLYNQKVVKSEKAFIAAAAADPRSKSIQPGTYKLYEQMPARNALLILIDPKNIVGNKVLITEGMI